MLFRSRWRDWAGEYDLGSGFRIAVFERDGKLFIQGSGQVAIEAGETGDDRIEVAVRSLAILHVLVNGLRTA